MEPFIQLHFSRRRDECERRDGCCDAAGRTRGLGIFTIDKGIITADTHRPGVGKYVSFVVRVAMVLGAALLTAQPIEQLVFPDLVEEHLKHEIIREEAVAYAWRHDELSRARRSPRRAIPEAELPGWVGAEVKDELRSWLTSTPKQRA
ncbi:MAG: hypothetical protein IPI49_14915 [Myxococcales bacterium]|nr:hypothetical protein [Myxococcales bacterium]